MRPTAAGRRRCDFLIVDLTREEWVLFDDLTELSGGRDRAATSVLRAWIRDQAAARAARAAKETSS